MVSIGRFFTPWKSFSDCVARIVTCRLFPLGFSWQTFPHPLRKCRRFQITYMGHGLVGFPCRWMQAREVSDEPLTVMLFPVERRLPFFTIDRLPTFREPPAKVLVAAVAYEFKKLSVTYESLIDGKILQEDLVRGLFIVESKIIVAAFESVLRSWSGSCVAKPKQASFDFRHPFDCHRGRWPRFHSRGELIAQQM